MPNRIETIITEMESNGESPALIARVVQNIKSEQKAKADWDKKHAEEKAKIEAERKAAKEEEATNAALEKSFTFQTGVEPEEEVEPIGILAPEVEKTAKEKNTELVNQNAAENDKRQSTDFEAWYTDVFVPQQKKTNPYFYSSRPEDYEGHHMHKDRFWKTIMSRGGSTIDYAAEAISGTLSDTWIGRMTGAELDEYNMFGKGDDLPDVEMHEGSSNRFFWKSLGHEDLNNEYKQWQDKASIDLPDNIFETPSFEDYEAVQLPSATGTTTTYRIKDGVEAGKDKQVISAKEYNKLKTEAEDQQIADDPSLGIYKKQQEAKGNKDFKFYEAKYKEALDNNDSETAKHYFHKIKETDKESKVIPSDNNLAGEMSEYYRLKESPTGRRKIDRDKLGGFLDYYSEEEAQKFLRDKEAEIKNAPSEHMFSQEDLEKAGIDSEDFHNFVNNSNNKNQINQNYVFDFDENGNIVKSNAPGILDAFAEDEDVFKADILNGYLNSKLQPLKKMEQQYENLGVFNDIESLNSLQLELKDGRTELDTKIQDAKDYAADIKSGKIKRTEENLDKLISMNAEVEVLTDEFNNNIVEYNDYFKNETKSKLIDGYGDFATQYKDFQKLYLQTYTSNETLTKQKLEAGTPTNLERYQKNPTVWGGIKAYGGLIPEVAENLGNVATNMVTGGFAILQNIAGSLVGANSEDRLRMMSNWTNMQDQYLEMNFIEYGSFIKPNGDINWWAGPGQVARTTGDIFAMAGGSSLVRGGIRGIGKGGKNLAYKTGFGKTTLDNLFDASRRRILAPITTKAVNATSQFLGVTPVIFPGKLRDAMSQLSDDFTADDALRYAWQATTVESAIEMINPDIKLLNRWGKFKREDMLNMAFWKNGRNARKAWKLFNQSLATVPAELLEENLQEFFGGQVNAMYNRLHETEFHIPTASDYKAVNVLTPMAILVAGGVRTRGFRRGDRSNMMQGALEDLPAFTKELDKQLELYISTDGKEGISKDDHKRILEEVVLYGAQKDKMGIELLQNLSPEETFEWIQLMAQREKIEAQIKVPKTQNKKELQKDLDNTNKRMKDLSKEVQMTTANQTEVNLDGEINNLENELKDKEAYPEGSPESLAVIEEIKKLREQRNKVRQETPLYSFNNKTYDTEEEFLEAIDEAKRNGFFKNNKNPLIKISHRVPNGHDVKAKVYETMGEDAPDIDTYSGRKLMNKQEVDESEKLLNQEEYFGKTIRDLEFALLEEQDPAKRSEIEQALEYLRIKDRGYVFDNKLGAFVMTGKDIDFSRAKKLAVERYIKAAEEVAEAAGAKTEVMSNNEIQALILQGLLDPNVGDANGFFTQDIEIDENGNEKIVGYKWVINKDRAIAVGQDATATHEMLHGILWSVLNGPTRILLDKNGKQVLDPDGNPVKVTMTVEGEKLLKGFLKLLPQKYIDILDKKLDGGRYRFYEYKDGVGVKGTERPFESYGEEYLAMFHEAVVVDKVIPQEENKSLFRKIIDWFNSFFKKETNNELTNIDIKTPEELMQFLKTYNAQAIKGKFDDQVKELAKRSYEQYREDKPGLIMYSKTEVNQTDIKSSLDKFVQKPDGTRKYETKDDFQISNDFTDAWAAITDSNLLDGMIKNQAIADGLTVMPEGFVQQVKERISERFIKNFDPAKNESLFGWLLGKTKAGRSILKLSAGDVVNKIKDQIPIKSEAEAVIDQFKAEEEIKQEEERKIKLATRLGVNSEVNKVIAKILPTLNIAKLNFKTLKNLIPEITGEMFGISLKKIISGANITKGELQSAQMFINKNADILIAMLPEGVTASGTSTGVPNTLLKAFYTKTGRAIMAKTGTKAGLAVQVKNPNITKKQFLEVFGIIDGKPIRTDRNTSARVLALANLTGRMISNQTVRETLIKDESSPSHVIALLGDGKSQIMFSKGAALNKNIKNAKSLKRQSVQLIADDALDILMKQEQGRWPSILKMYGLTPIDMKTPEGRKMYKMWMFNELNQYFPLEFFEHTGNWTGTFKTLDFYIDEKGKKVITKKGHKGNYPFTEAPEVKAAIDQALANNIMWQGEAMSKQDKQDIANALRRVPQNQKNLTDEEFKASKLRGFELIWKTFDQMIKDNPSNAPFIAALLSSSSAYQRHFMRTGSLLEFLNTLNEENIEEHTQAATDLGKFLFNRLMQGNLNEYIGPAMNAYFQGSLPLRFDNLLKGKDFDYQSDAGKYTYDVLLGVKSVWIRYFNPDVNNNNGGIDPNVIVLANGNTIAQEFGVDVSAELLTPEVIAQQQQLLYEIFNGDITVAQARKNINSFASVKFTKDILLEL